MPLYAYQAVDAGGRRTRGRLSAATATALVRDLEGRGLLALQIDEATEANASGGLGFGFGRRTAVLEFTRAVAALLPAGMPLAKALAAGAATAPVSVRPVLDAVRAKVERGDELATALAEHPKLFTSLYVGIVRAGEKSGALDQAFVRLADHLEREDELRSKLVSMSIYPALLALVGAASVLVLVLFVLPRFAELLLSSGATLPATAAVIVGLTEWLSANWRILLVLPPAFLIAFAWLRTAKSGRRFGSNALIYLPVVGNWRRQTLAARFARMVGELLTGGAPLLMALQDAEDCMTDPVAQAETERIRSTVREGSALHAAISQRNIFPAVLPQLVALGEDAGRLAQFLIKSAELLERKTERTLERMVAIAEPAMIIGFGGIVALVALALLQAIYGVNAGSF